MFEIVFRIEGGGEVNIEAVEGESILAIARKANVAIDAPCSGNMSCGKCRIKLVDGELGGGKTRHLTDEEAAGGWRLACASTVIADAVIGVPDIASAYKSRMKSADLSSPEEVRVFETLMKDLETAGIERDSGLRVFDIELESPTLDDTMPDNERLLRAVKKETGYDSLELPVSLLQKLPDTLRDSDFAVRVLTLGDSVLDVLPRNDSRSNCGLVIDIGTTTVSALLIDLLTGGILAKATAGNGQIRYGADVINRIVEQQKAGGVRKLRDGIIIETLKPLIDLLCKDADVAKTRIYRVAVASNATMNHLLLGINANPLRMEPYIPAFFKIPPFPASDLGLELAKTATVLISPNIGSYVGGDITAGALAGLLWNTEELTVLIDLGTNGEIVFGNSEFLMSCACSAGPAFEGGDISCGMRATDGAIEALTIDRESMEPNLNVIGGGRPVGLCGSGLIDTIGELFAAGLINGKGKFIREGERILHDEYGIGSYVLAHADETAQGTAIAITEVDIDNFIRAKGAIYSAIISLTEPLGFSPADLDRVLVAGGIGSGINIKNAIRIGMLPDLPEEKYTYIGNSSLTGAYAMLISRSAAEKLDEIASSMTYVELSTMPGYMDSFIAACFLPHTDGTLFPSVS